MGIVCYIRVPGLPGEKEETRVDKFDKSAYDQEYQRKNIVIKRVPFNRQTESDRELLAWVEGRNFSGYVKGLIRDDMDGGAENVNRSEDNDAQTDRDGAGGQADGA